MAELNAWLSAMELLTNDNERHGLLAAFEDILAGRVRSLEEIERELKKEL